MSQDSTEKPIADEEDLTDDTEEETEIEETSLLTNEDFQKIVDDALAAATKDDDAAAKVEAIKSVIGVCLSDESVNGGFFSENLAYLQSNALQAIPQGVKDLLAKAGNLDEDGGVALAMIAYDAALSVNDLALDVLRRSIYGVVEEDYFAVAGRRYTNKLKPFLQLRGVLTELEVALPDDTETQHWSQALFKKATTVTTYQGLAWTEVEECIGKIGQDEEEEENGDEEPPAAPGGSVPPEHPEEEVVDAPETRTDTPLSPCSVVDRKKLEQLYAGSIGPTEDKDFVPPIRGQFLEKGIGLDAAGDFEKMGRYDSQAITEDDIKIFEKNKKPLTTDSQINRYGSKLKSQLSTQGKLKSQLSTQVRAVSASKKDNYYSTPSKSTTPSSKSLDSVSQEDMAKLQAEVDAARAAEQAKANDASKKSLDLLDQLLDPKSKILEDETAVKNKLTDMKSQVEASQAFLETGQNFQGSDALQQRLVDGAMDFDTSGGVVQSYASNEELVASASGGQALHGISLLLEGHPVENAGMPALMTPSYVNMLGVTQPFQTFTFKTTSETESNRFHKTASSGGMSMAESSSKSYGASVSGSGYGYSASASYGHTTQKSSSSSSTYDDSSSFSMSAQTSEAHLTEYIKMPMRSFRIPYDSMRLSDEVKLAVKHVATEDAALEFLLAFGTHVAFGMHTLGGVFFRSISMKSEASVSTVSMFSAAGQQLSEESGKSDSVSASASGKAWGVKLSAAFSMDSASKSGTKSFQSSAMGDGEAKDETHAFFNATVTTIGPNAPTPSTFAQLLSTNTGTWSIIDRGAMDELLPLWLFIEEEMLVGDEAHEAKDKKIRKAVHLMKRVWIAKAQDWMDRHDAPLFSPMIRRAIMDEIKKKEAITDMVRSICAVVDPKLNKQTGQKDPKLNKQTGQKEGDRLSMLKSLKVVVSKAADKVMRDDFESNDFWIKDFLEQGGSETDTYTFSARTPADTSPYVASAQDLKKEDPVRQAHSTAMKAAHDLGGDSESWDWLIDDFVTFAEACDLPYFKASDDKERMAHLWNCLYDDGLQLAPSRIKTDGGTIVSHYGTKQEIHCPDGVTPSKAILTYLEEFMYPTMSWDRASKTIKEDTVKIKRTGREVYSLYPGVTYFLVYKENSQALGGQEILTEKESLGGQEILTEREFLARGGILFVNATPKAISPESWPSSGCVSLGESIDANEESFFFYKEKAKDGTAQDDKVAFSWDGSNVSHEETSNVSDEDKSNVSEKKRSSKVSDQKTITRGQKYVIHSHRSDPFCVDKPIVSTAVEFSALEARPPPVFLMISRQNEPRRLFAEKVSDDETNAMVFGSAPKHKTYHVCNFWRFVPPTTDHVSSSYYIPSSFIPDMISALTYKIVNISMPNLHLTSEVEPPPQGGNVAIRATTDPFDDATDSWITHHHGEQLFSFQNKETGAFLCERDFKSSDWGEAYAGAESSANSNAAKWHVELIDEAMKGPFLGQEKIRFVSSSGSFAEDYGSKADSAEDDKDEDSEHKEEKQRVALEKQKILNYNTHTKMEHIFEKPTRVEEISLVCSKPNLIEAEVSVEFGSTTNDSEWTPIVDNKIWKITKVGVRLDVPIKKEAEKVKVIVKFKKDKSEWNFDSLLPLTNSPFHFHTPPFPSLRRFTLSGHLLVEDVVIKDNTHVESDAFLEPMLSRES